jgi:hypothetical protein
MMTKSGKEPESAEIIPVFAIVRRGSVQRAAHPDYSEPLSSEGEEEILNRVGSAWRQQDGSYLIQLVAFPVNGQLLLRPLTEKEFHSATHQERKP